MRHTNFRDTDSSFKVIDASTSNVEAWKFTLTDGLTSLGSFTPETIGTYTKTEITTPSEDCMLLTVQDGKCSMIRVGDPEVLVIGFTGTINESWPYTQYSTNDGAELDNGIMAEIGEGFYYVEPLSLEESFFILAGGLIKTLSVPYGIGNCTEDGGDTGLGFTVSKNFVNVGFNTFGYLGERYSYFDLVLGKWVNDETVEAKASDLAKAACYKYNKVWEDRNDPEWIGNYIKYIRTYDETAKKFRFYAVAVTPDTNDANSPLVQTDEDGNTQVKGLSLLMLQNLETINNEDGAIIPFKEL